MGLPRAVWCLGFYISTAGVWVLSLVRELGSYMEYGLAKRKTNLNVVIMMVMSDHTMVVAGGDSG